MGAWTRYEPKALNDEVLIFYGYGGGGGGPYLDAAKGRFPVWDGELYLQFYRGTLTSVARTKANNRQAERALREVECLSAMAMRAGVDYPSEQIDSLWKLALINQFHDILPGTSIAEVYADAAADYAALVASRHKAARAKAREGLTLFNFTGQARAGDLV